MPAFATHEIFGQEGLEGILPEELFKAVEKHKAVFRIGCQGPDIFLYNPFFLLGKKQVNLGRRMHETRTGRFFQVYLQELLKVRDREKLEIGISYFLGFLSHYSLDCGLHPYIYGKSGYQEGKADSGVNTMPQHHRLEAVMDKLMLMAKRECMPSSYYPEKRIQICGQELLALAEIMSTTLQRVYRVFVKPRHIRMSYWWMKKVMKQVYDHTGRQKQQVCRFESLVWHRPVIGNMIVSDQLQDTWDVMNQRGEEWQSPWETDWTFDSSAWELYDNAIERYQIYVQAVQPVLSGMLKRMALLEKRQSRAAYVGDILQKWIPGCVSQLGNKNYHTGL